MQFDWRRSADLGAGGWGKETGAVFDCIAEYQLCLVGAGSSDDDVVIADGYGLVQVVCAGVDEDGSASDSADGGACVGQCPTEALSMNEDFELVFNPEECIACGRCAVACTFNAIAVEFGD